MVVPARRDERRLPAPALLNLESEDPAIEVDAPLEVGDLEVDVPDADGGINGTTGFRHGSPCGMGYHMLAPADQRIPSRASAFFTSSRNAAHCASVQSGVGRRPGPN